MAVTSLNAQIDALIVVWTDDNTTRFPTIWLRDNCSSGLHPDTRECVNDLLTIDDAQVLISAKLKGDTTVLKYAEGYKLMILETNQGRLLKTVLSMYQLLKHYSIFPKQILILGKHLKRTVS
jgi:hypothetical protein|tara:strand:+ start:117 stop:482 length:366 start_codon:yes stop_codon:yes gene_type:complete